MILVKVYSRFHQRTRLIIARVSKYIYIKINGQIVLVRFLMKFVHQKLYLEPSTFSILRLEEPPKFYAPKAYRSTNMRK